MQFFVVLGLSLLFALPAFAQSPAATVAVAGVVVDAGTRAPIAGAMVSVDDQQSVADPRGVFVLTMSPGRRTIGVTAPGYFPLVTTLEVGTAGVTGAELALAKDEGFASSVDVVAAAPGMSSGNHVFDVGAEAHWLETTLRFAIDGDRNPSAANGSSVQGGAEFYAEVINLLNRRNAGSIESQLEYDPGSDRPRIVEEREQSIPRLPTIGARFRF